MRKLFITIASLLTLSASAQDLSLTQSFSSPLQLNPAIMGSNQNLRVDAGYRSQWAPIADGYKTFKFNAMSPVWEPDANSKLDVGASFINDKAGAWGTNDIQLAVSFDRKLDKYHHLTVSLSGGFIAKKFDAASVTWDDQYNIGTFSQEFDTEEVFSEEKTSVIDAGFGLMWYYVPANDKFQAYAGLSSSHFHTPDQALIQNSEDGLAAKWSAQGGIKAMTSHNLDISPAFRAIRQGGAKEYSLGCYFDYTIESLSSGSATSASDSTATAMSTDSTTTDSKDVFDAPQMAESPATVTLGGWFNQQSKTFAMIVGLRYDMYAIGYSYGLAKSPLKAKAFGTSTHEITLSFLLNRTGKHPVTPFHLW